ncbi:MAG: transketolase [Thermoleophilia bacterium]|nr:transketolase [Thermoleophilia bacterium]
MLNLEKTANLLRQDVIRMTAAAASGHPGGSLSSADIVAALYFQVMNHRPAEPKWPQRDRFILSKGHCAPVLYAALARSGYFPAEDLLNLRKIDCHLQGHPDMHKTTGVEISSGSLGQGLSISIGMALATRLDSLPGHIFTLLGDGESQEGQVWEAAMAAAQYRLDNLTAIIDVNGLQIDGHTRDVMNVEPLAAKYEAFGWTSRDIDGHDLEQVIDSLQWSRTVAGPVAIVARTVKGKGVSFMENEAGWHGKAPSPEQERQALAELNAQAEALAGEPAEASN